MLMDNLEKLSPPIKVKPIPCLKCDCARIEIHRYTITQADAPWRLVCSKCQNWSGWGKTLEETIETWNTKNTKTGK